MSATPNSPRDPMPDDVCLCASPSPVSNNNHVDSGVKSRTPSPELAPYVVSLTRKRRNHILPPLSGGGGEADLASPSAPPSASASPDHRTHNSQRKSSRGRHHGKAAGLRGHHGSAATSKRTLSAVSRGCGDEDAADTGTPIIELPIRPVRPQTERRPKKKHLLLGTPEKLSRVNKIETVRILRARPVFYPAVRDRYSSGSSSSPSAHHLHHHGHHHHHHKTRSAGRISVSRAVAAATVLSSSGDDLDVAPAGHAPSGQVTGKHITLSSERNSDLVLKRSGKQRRNAKAPASAEPFNL